MSSRTAAMLTISYTAQTAQGPGYEFLVTTNCNSSLSADVTKIVAVAFRGSTYLPAEREISFEEVVRRAYLPGSLQHRSSLFGFVNATLTLAPFPQAPRLNAILREDSIHLAFLLGDLEPGKVLRVVGQFNNVLLNGAVPHDGPVVRQFCIQDERLSPRKHLVLLPRKNSTRFALNESPYAPTTADESPEQLMQCLAQTAREFEERDFGNANATG